MKIIIGDKMIKTKGKIEDSNSKYEEWFKWLSYEPDFEKERKKELNSKLAGELSLEEINELRKYKINGKFKKLFESYFAGEISWSESLDITEYMRKESLEKLMAEKLTKEELEYAREEISKIKLLSDDEIMSKVEEYRENYNELSMVDSCLFHTIISDDYTLTQYKLKKDYEKTIK